MLHRNTSTTISVNDKQNKHQSSYCRSALLDIHDIFDTEADKDLIAKRVIYIAKECVWFGVEDVFVFSLTAHTWLSSAFISAVDKILQDKWATH